MKHILKFIGLWCLIGLLMFAGVVGAFLNIAIVLYVFWKFTGNPINLQEKRQKLN